MWIYRNKILSRVWLIEEICRTDKTVVVVTDPIQNGGQIGGKFKTGGLYVSSAYFFN